MMSGIMARSDGSRKSIVQTFGVEFEFVFAFHQDKLQEVLDTAPDNVRPKLLKKFHPRVHQQFVQPGVYFDASQGRRKWPAWIFQVGVDGDESHVLDVQDRFRPKPVRLNPDVGAVGHDWRTTPTWFRDYFVEHLIIARNILATKSLSASIVGYMLDNYPSAWLDNHKADKSWPTQNVFLTVKKQREFHRGRTLTNDASIIGATKGELLQSLNGLVTQESVQDWDSHGVELVSPVFKLDSIDEACAEIQQYFSALNHRGTSPPVSPFGSSATQHGTRSTSEYGETGWDSATSTVSEAQKWAAFDSVFAGTHVHIGLNWDNGSQVSASQRFLRHLIFIVLCNETLISQLHPRRRWSILTEWSPVNPVFRHAESAETDAERETRELAEEEIRVSELEEKYTSRACLQSNRAYFVKTYLKLDHSNVSDNEIAKAVFQDLDLMSRTSRLLDGFQPRKGESGERMMIVNLSNLRSMLKAGKYLDMSHQSAMTFKPTIEFRQHACTLNAGEVNHWVKFCQAIVQLAERRGEEKSDAAGLEVWQQEMSKHTQTCDDIETFCGPSMLNLNQTEIEYWRGRHDQYREDEKIELRNRIRRRVSRIRMKKQLGLSIKEEERRSLRIAREDCVSDSKALVPDDYTALASPSREEYEALDTSQLKRIAVHRDSIGERGMKRQRKEDYIDFIQSLDQKGKFGDGIGLPEEESEQMPGSWDVE